MSRALFSGETKSASICVTKEELVVESKEERVESLVAKIDVAIDIRTDDEV